MLSQIEPKEFEETSKDKSWANAMNEEEQYLGPSS